MGMPKTSKCAAGAYVSGKVPAGDDAVTPIDPLCICPASTYLSPTAATCNDCTALVDLISTLYHECVHQGQCALTDPTDRGREREAYCDEAAFDQVKLLGQCRTGLCGKGVGNINDCLQIVHRRRNVAIAKCKSLGGTVNYNIPFS
jgi:hypothetical protein